MIDHTLTLLASLAAIVIVTGLYLQLRVLPKAHETVASMRTVITHLKEQIEGLENKCKNLLLDLENEKAESLHYANLAESTLQASAHNSELLATANERIKFLEDLSVSQEYVLRQTQEVVHDPKMLQDFLHYLEGRRQQDQMMQLLTGKQSSVSEEESPELADRITMMQKPISGLSKIEPASE